MAELFTTNYGFVKPQPGTGEPAAIEKINSNFDKVEKWGRVIWVNDGVIPATADLIEGSIVAEITSGKVWIAKKNVGGTFDRKFIRYPWSMSAFTTNFPVGTSGWAEYGFQNFGGGTFNGVGPPINSSAADIVGGRVVLPVKGLYSIRVNVNWAPNNTGIRASALSFNGIPLTGSGPPNDNTSTYANTVQNSDTRYSIFGNEVYPAGTQFCTAQYQNSGGTINLTIVVFAHLVYPVD